MYDSGYEVIDHMDVDPELGTMADFEELLQGAHNRSKTVQTIVDIHSRNPYRFETHER